MSSAEDYNAWLVKYRNGDKDYVQFDVYKRAVINGRSLVFEGDASDVVLDMDRVVSYAPCHHESAGVGCIKDQSKTYRIYDMDGHAVGEILNPYVLPEGLAKGVYVVKGAEKTYKVLVK